jgi:hypothetical protein
MSNRKLLHRLCTPRRLWAFANLDLNIMNVRQHLRQVTHVDQRAAAGQLPK